MKVLTIVLLSTLAALIVAWFVVFALWMREFRQYQRLRDERASREAGQ